MQVLKMVMRVTVEMLMTSFFQLILENVTSHALAIKISSVAARGVCKFMILDYSEIQPRRRQRRHKQPRH